MEKAISFTLNGQPRNVTTDPERPLLEVRREDLDLTGTKYGCGESQCGACTVLVDGVAVRSCVRGVGFVAGLVGALEKKPVPTDEDLIAPAIGNAVFQATGRRLRAMPLRLDQA